VNTCDELFYMSSSDTEPKSLAREGISGISYAVQQCCSLWKTCGKLVHAPASLQLILYPPTVLFFLCTFAFPQVLQDPSEKYFPYFGAIGAIFNVKPYTINKKCTSYQCLAQVFRQKSRGFYPGVN
jgi:hypothetical protein